jgi:hypothetical protein
MNKKSLIYFPAETIHIRVWQWAGNCAFILSMDGTFIFAQSSYKEESLIQLV